MNSLIRHSQAVSVLKKSWTLFFGTVLLCVIALYVISFSASNTYTVINTDNSGAGSLRQAILDANSNPGTDMIEFNIPGGGLQTISPTSALPAISDSVVIDGYTQPGSQVNTVSAPDSSDAVLLIELDGTSAGGTTHGLRINAGDSTVKGLIINNFGRNGIRLYTNGNNTITGNYIGLDDDGITDAGNGRNGIQINNISGNTIGGTDSGDRNVISGNTQRGIYSQNSVTANTIIGNFIGTDVSGTADVGNTRAGVHITGATNDVVGGTDAGARNLISGNEQEGILVSNSSTGVEIKNNYIGTDINGTVDLGNTREGIVVNNSTSVVIGGSTEDERNLVSGNESQGIQLENGATLAVVQGNYVGVDSTGIAKLGNTTNGIRVNASPSNNIEDNVVSGNGTAGIVIRGAASVSNTVEGNFVGTDTGASIDLGNGTHGVNINSGATNNDIGSITSGAGNTIAYNGSNGISVNGSGTNSNSFRGNSVFLNVLLGIDLRNNGVTNNDNLDGDGNSNLQQNYPFVSSSRYNFGTDQTTIAGTFNSAASSTFDLDFYANDVPDSSNYGEGKTYIGSTSVVTNGSGDAPFSVAFTGDYSTSFVSSTATDSGNNTSEFSTMNQIDLEVTKTTPTLNALIGDPLTYTVTVANNGPDTATDVDIEDVLPTHVSYVSDTPSQGTYSTGTGIWAVGNLANGSSATLILDVTISNCGYVINNVIVSNVDEYDTDSTNDFGEVIVPTPCPPEMSPTPPSAGGRRKIPTELLPDEEVVEDEEVADSTEEELHEVAEDPEEPVVCLEYHEDRDLTFLDIDEEDREYGYFNILKNVYNTQEEEYLISGDAIATTVANANLDQTVSRYEFVKAMMLANCYSIPDEIPQDIFYFIDFNPIGVDSKSKVYVARVMYGAVAYDLIGGYPDFTMRPFQEIQLGEAAKIMFLATGKDESYATSFTLLPLGIDGDEWYWRYMAYMITLMRTDQITSDTVIDRAQFAEMVVRMIENEKVFEHSILKQFRDVFRATR